MEVRGTDPRNITGRTTVVQTNSLGDPMALQAQKDFFGMDGKRVATIFGESAGSSPTYRTPPRQTNQRIAQGGLPTQQSTVATGFFDSLIKGASTPTSEGRSFQQQNYLQDSEKAFSFFPDLANRGRRRFADSKRSNKRGIKYTCLILEFRINGGRGN